MINVKRSMLVVSALPDPLRILAIAHHHYPSTINLPGKTAVCMQVALTASPSDRQRSCRDLVGPRHSLRMSSDTHPLAAYSRLTNPSSLFPRHPFMPCPSHHHGRLGL